jgi:hypothetical protein
LREHAAEVRTLRAIGWSARDLARLTLWNALWPGAAGGLAAGMLDLLGGTTVAGTAPPRLIALACLTVAAGVAMSLFAAVLATIFSRSTTSANY